MPSPLFVSLTTSLGALRSSLIATGKEYDQYTVAEHQMALAFRVLASAHLEDYAEQRCVDVARAGAQRLQKAQPTRAGRALLIWYLVNGNGLRGPIPLEAAEYPVDRRVSEALTAFQRAASQSHGLSGKKLLSMVFRLGLSESDLDLQLFDSLDTLAGDRGAAAHLRVNRAKRMTEPETEWIAVEAVLPLLEKLDTALTLAVG